MTAPLAQVLTEPGAGQPVTGLALALPTDYADRDLDLDRDQHDYPRQEFVMLHHHLLPRLRPPAHPAGVSFCTRPAMIRNARCDGVPMSETKRRPVLTLK